MSHGPHMTDMNISYYALISGNENTLKRYSCRLQPAVINRLLVTSEQILAAKGYNYLMSYEVIQLHILRRIQPLIQLEV